MLESTLDTLTLWCSYNCPHLAVRLAAVVAAAGRLAGCERLARAAAAWGYDVADSTMSAEPAFATHRATMPWAWNADRTLLAWWGRA
jgi:hypothetical protein